MQKKGRGIQLAQRKPHFLPQAWTWKITSNERIRKYWRDRWLSRWWFQTFFYFHPYLGKIPNLTNIFQMGGSTTNQLWEGPGSWNLFCFDFRPNQCFPPGERTDLPHWWSIRGTEGVMMEGVLPWNRWWLWRITNLPETKIFAKQTWAESQKETHLPKKTMNFQGATC